MFGLFKKSPEKQLQKEYDALLNKAFLAQRDGNIRLYSALTAEAEAVKAKIDAAGAADSAAR
ncbi:MAG: Lacal_2735 family protein [Halioglobus sp.]|nr:Lacal_2735 family protein [Halioglobus sp.]